MSSSSQTPSTSSSASPPTYPTHPFPPPPLGSPYTYTPAHFTRLDPSPDSDFYSVPRFVTHIDDGAIERLKRYYEYNLLPNGDGRGSRVLDLCSSWVSHLPAELEERAVATARGEEGKGEEGLSVVGVGMNKEELDANPVLRVRIVQDLNSNPELTDDILGEEGEMLDATTCVVSIDYLTQPVEVLRSVWQRTREGGRLHIVVSNRCFPSKVVGGWLGLGEGERLRLVGGYVWWAGWRGVEVVELREEGGEEGKGLGGRLRGIMGVGGDPLWVVRGVKVKEGGGEGGGKEEL
ncbi:MAG: hypothetical protein Q9220_005776 [cf. Caloplaca sp. 1 TL-2023]